MDISNGNIDTDGTAAAMDIENDFSNAPFKLDITPPKVQPQTSQQVR